MLQSFYFDVAKVDRWILHLLYMLQVFQTYVAIVFDLMLHMFHTYVATVCFKMFELF
jgi:hypothetical protein